MSITYEITALVRDDLIPEFERYMVDRHIPDLMATGSFETAIFSRAAAGRYRIRYELPDREALDVYLREHAPRLRADMHQTFPEGVELSRDEWEVLASF